MTPASTLPHSTPRVALVTGAARRIGRAIALGLARDGWDIAVHYRDSRDEALSLVAEITALGRRAQAFPCNLAQEDAVRQLLPQAQAALGAVTCVVNNASLFEYDNAGDFSFTALDAHMHANLAAPILLAQALYQATPAGGQAVVINLLDQKLYNLNPDFCRTPCPRRRCCRRPPCWPRRWRRKCAWWALPRHHHGLRRTDGSELRQGA